MLLVELSWLSNFHVLISMQFPCSSWYNDLNSFTANKQNVRLLDSSASMIFHVLEFSLTLFRMGFFGAAHGWGWRVGKKVPSPYNLSHIFCNDETWHSYTLPKEDPQNIWVTSHNPWVLLTSAFFHWKSGNFAISRNTDIDCILIHNFYLF